MKFVEIIQEILLALSIAILMPVTVYWGINTFYPTVKVIETEKQEETTEAKELESKQKQQRETQEIISFWVYLSIAILVITIGSFVKNNSLSMGLNGGGVLNLIMSISNSSKMPLINFSVFLILFI